MFKLRYFQDGIVNDIRSALVENYINQVIVSPTGSGKTIMFSYIAKNAQSKNKRVLIITHRKEILEQTLSKLFSFGVQCGQIKSGRPMTRDLIQVAMVLTLKNRVDKIQKPDLIICDEGHHFLFENQYGKVLHKFLDVPKLFFTATPERLSGEGLGYGHGGFGDIMIKGPSICDLVNDGFLAYPQVFRPAMEIDDSFKITRGEFDSKEQEKVFTRNAIVGDVIEHYKKYFNGAPIVCFCASIKHAQMMADVYNSNGFRAMAVYSGMGDDERKQAFKGLENGTIQILTNCSLIDEGVDIPNVAGVQLLCKTRSLSKYLQRVGRALRPVFADGYDLETKEGRLNAQLNGPKPRAIILDHANNHSIHGHVLSDRDWSLNHGKRNHKKDVAPTTTSCPKCYGVWPGKPKQCPDCNFIFADNDNVAGQQRKPPEQIAGELIAALPDGIEPNQVQSLTAFVSRLQGMNPQKRKKAMIAKAFELQDRNKIDALTKAVGYKRGWTDHIWKKVLGNH